MNLMVCLILGFSMFWQSEEAKPGKTHFTPIPEGNVIQVGPFEFTVPESQLLAYGENAQYMYRLLQAQSIDRCEGILFSTSATWSYGISIQFEPSNDLVYQPVLTAEQFEQLWQGRSIFSGNNGDLERKVRYPLEMNAEEKSVFFGYDEKGADGQEIVIARKVYMSNEGMLVLTLRSDLLQHSAFEPEILRAFHEGVTPAAYDSKPPAGGQKSVLQLFGVRLSLNPSAATPPANSPAATEPEGPNLVLSGVVIGIALLVLFGAFVLSRKN